MYNGELNKSDMLSYYGTMVGSFVTAFITVVGLYFTLKQNTKTFNIQRNIDKKNREDDKINNVMPILKINKDFSTYNFDQCLSVKHQSDDRSSCDTLKIYVKNIGVGPAINLKIKLGSYYAANSAGVDNTFDLGVNEVATIQITTKFDLVSTEKDGKKYIPIVLECEDIYKKRVYTHYINAIKHHSSNFEVFENDKKEIKEI